MSKRQHHWRRGSRQIS